MQAQNGINSYSQGDLQRMIRQVSDLYTQTAEATAKEVEDASGLSEAGGENFKVSCLSTCQHYQQREGSRVAGSEPVLLVYCMVSMVRLAGMRVYDKQCTNQKRNIWHKQRKLF